MEAPKYFQLRLSAEEHEAIRVLAFEARQSMNEFIRELIRKAEADSKKRKRQ